MWTRTFLWDLHIYFFGQKKSTFHLDFSESWDVIFQIHKFVLPYSFCQIFIWKIWVESVCGVIIIIIIFRTSLTCIHKINCHLLNLHNVELLLCFYYIISIWWNWPHLYEQKNIIAGLTYSQGWLFPCYVFVIWTIDPCHYQPIYI